MSADERLIAEVIEFALISPNEADSNGESANVVDGLFAIARALNRIATSIEAKAEWDVQSDHLKGG